MEHHTRDEDRTGRRAYLYGKFAMVTG